MQTPTSGTVKATPGHDRHVQDNFGPRANAYVESTVHSQGEDLNRLAKIVQDLTPRNALDLGAGGGHVSYTIAPHVGAVTAVDLSASMLAAVDQTATSKGLTNVQTTEASAEHLPFADATFDFLACRYSAHHWHDVNAGLREARRVLSKGANAIFIDVVAPAAPLLNTHLQAIELLRDTSHVRNYTVAEWTEMLGRAGFEVTGLRPFRLRMEFKSWTKRIGTPEPLCAAISMLQEKASREVKSHFAIEPDGSFMLDMVMFETASA
ncbi:class I SAM-dependent methyltransferase [Allorhizobium terrae]|uniref:Methyltransferase domain-containing protein n=1 Tax=Allorhizobium terrae TaxID=1848972 RepID=A0A4S4A609_9HYPH|nr:class I SAM-dependent methyltransferase [Allorhizobium terrae]THF53991.1 methyltransferase domain-containing protein [Allorhizobium terrae]